jgi:hypothetical protein
MTVENFDKWLSNNFYPALAGMNPALEGYNMTPAVAKRYAELCAGEVENAFDRKLREKVYPVLAWVQAMPRSEHREF